VFVDSQQSEQPTTQGGRFLVKDIRIGTTPFGRADKTLIFSSDLNVDEPISVVALARLDLQVPLELASLFDMAVEDANHVVVTDTNLDAVFRINLTSRELTLVSGALKGTKAKDPTNPNLPLSAPPRQIVVEKPSGNFLVRQGSFLVRIMKDTGDRSIIASLTDLAQTPPGNEPSGWHSRGIQACMSIGSSYPILPPVARASCSRIWGRT
jgi:hypothetical protein